jgi:transcriptional regulator with XRE-family HTH domain
MCDDSDMRNASYPLHVIAGRRLREVRQTSLMTQDHIARAARALGLSWGRSSVAQLESGRRRLSAEELFLLPGVVAVAADLAGVPLIHPGRLADFVTPAANGRTQVELTDVVSLDASSVTALLDGDATATDSARKAAASSIAAAGVETEMERRLAAQHGLNVSELEEAAQVLWGRSLYEERERRIEASGDARSDQALRGHVTRALVAEILEHLGED